MRKTVLAWVEKLANDPNRLHWFGSGAGTLENMKINHPDRFFMEGVSEQHIIGMAAGLAMEGFMPYVNTIATFLTGVVMSKYALDLCLHGPSSPIDR